MRSNCPAGTPALQPQRGARGVVAVGAAHSSVRQGCDTNTEAKAKTKTKTNTITKIKTNTKTNTKIKTITKINTGLTCTAHSSVRQGCGRRSLGMVSP